MSNPTIHLNQRQYLELEKIGLCSFSPLNGFMTEADFASVVDYLHLVNGAIFPLPVVLDVDEAVSNSIRSADTVHLHYQGEEVGLLFMESMYRCDKSSVARKVYGTDNSEHPGVNHFYKMGEHFVGGSVMLRKRVSFDFSKYEITPEESKSIFSKSGWSSVVGFQTRNVPHRAHEYLIRLALEQFDGVFVQPLVGRKKKGDYSPESILSAYTELKSNFLPKNRIVLGVLSTSMRYAGPREAVFHAIVRRNYGCTHFIVGRDHAGVGDYYGKYAAQDLCRQLESQLGIHILRYAGPFYCSICDGIVTERTCPHYISRPEVINHISGTFVRDTLTKRISCPPHIMRPEILSSIQGTQILIESDEP